MEVEIREEAVSSKADSTPLLASNTSTYTVADSPVVVVRAEEILLVALVLVIWVAAIALFFNRWGKIRMLEPYQPKFQGSHRASCPLSPPLTQVSSVQGRTQHQENKRQRMSFSKYNVNCLTDALYSAVPSPSHPSSRRPRQNSVFCSPSLAFVGPPRRVKSAIDIQHMIVNERSPITSFTGSLLPIVGTGRKPSITIERPHYVGSRHRPSISIEKPPLSHYHQFRARRSSCLVDRSITRHKNFMSLEIPQPLTTTAGERKTSVTIERPIINLDPPKDSPKRNSAVVEAVRASALAKGGGSRSFEQPALSDRPKTKRMCASLDVTAACVRLDSGEGSIVEEVVVDREAVEREGPEEEEGERVGSSMSGSLEEGRINAPLLESLKSSDV